MSQGRGQPIIAVIYALAFSGTLVVLAGCTGPVILRDPQTGKTVQCGPDDTEQSAELHQRHLDTPSRKALGLLPSSAAQSALINLREFVSFECKTHHVDARRAHRPAPSPTRPS